MRLWPGVMRKRSAIGSRHISRQELLTYVSCRLERTTNRYPMNAPSKCWHRENRTLAGLRDYVGHESSGGFVPVLLVPSGRAGLFLQDHPVWLKRTGHSA